MLRVVREVRPRYVVGENVAGLLSWNGGLVFDEVQADLEAEGYEVWAFVLPACSVDAPHRRDRVWFVARNANNISTGEERIFQGGTVAERDGVCAFKNVDQDGRGSNVREEKSGERQQRVAGARNNEWLCANNGETGLASHCSNAGVESVRQRRENQIHGFENAAHAESKRFSERNGESTWGQGQDTAIKRHNRIPEWSNFPTQPSICRRNDGVPNRLVGITVSKHRRESIKAYGNAIVPQVAYQIFQAIQKVEHGKL